jgi:hypothetical protein
VRTESAPHATSINVCEAPQALRSLVKRPLPILIVKH